MKTPLLLLGICSTVFANAQTLAESDTLFTGDMTTYYTCDSSATAYPDITGTGVTWDYSGITSYVELPGNVNEVTEATDSEFSDDFPSSAYVEDFENSINLFFSNDDDNDRVVVDGFVFQESGNDIIIKYDVDPLISLQFPMNQGDTFMDDIEGVAVTGLGPDTDISGTATITADGTGTLKLGPNDYTGVIRIHTLEVSTGVVFGATTTITRESYTYYQPGSFDLPIFMHGSIDVVSDAGAELGFTAVYSKDEITSYAGIEEATTSPLSLSVYPNPAFGNEVSIVTGENTSSIVVTNAIGQEVMRLNEPGTTEMLNISGLNNGIYFIQAANGTATRTEKLIVK